MSLLVLLVSFSDAILLPSPIINKAMTNKKPKIVPCPQCRQDAVYERENPYRPFCSERCKLIDLGQWANEGYTISSPVQTPPTYDD